MTTSTSLTLSRCIHPWLAFGLSWMLLGMMLLPTSKLYQQGLILFLWLPGLLALGLSRSVRLAWNRPLAWSVLAVAVWAGLSVLWGGDQGRLKEILYVVLAANAFVAMAALDGRLFCRVVACSALAGGLLAWIALANFYGLQGRDWSHRVVAMGLLNQTILASHVIGVLGLLLFYMRGWLPGALRGWPFWLGCAGCLTFLVLSRSKGPILALFCCLLLANLWQKSRQLTLLCAVVVSCFLLAVWLLPEQMLRGGASLRPQLLQAAWEQFMQHPWLGLGLGSGYELVVAGGHKAYEHAHNLYMHIAMQLGLVGVLLWLVVQGIVAILAWSSRRWMLGQALCAVWCFSAIAVLTDGIGPWVKPREEWFTVWLPVFLCFALMASRRNPSYLPHEGGETPVGRLETLVTVGDKR